jgi:Icc-related predicted phosphoesterase
VKVLVVGDIHEQFERLNELIDKKRPTLTIQCGDNAYFWLRKVSLERIRSQTPVYLLPGNHEDWDMLETSIGRTSTEPIKIENNVYYCPIGSSIRIKRKKILFLGGAESTDKLGRFVGIDWFPQEVLNYKDLNYILDNNKSADIVISHTCPISFDMKKYEYNTSYEDPTRYVLDIVLNEIFPSTWIFGHWHKYVRGSYRQTKWTCLDTIRSKKSWCIINI